MTEFPTEMISLPSKGKLYPENSPLRTGAVALRYMTAKDEDILLNQSYIEKGVVVDKLLQSLIDDKSINYSELLIGDKNALLIAARVLGYGKMYSFDYRGEKVDIDLSQIPDKPLDPVVENATENRFEFVLPVRGNKLTFKLLTHADETAIEQEIKGLKKVNKDASPELSTRMKYMIIAIDGDEDRKNIRAFVDNMLAADARAFRKYVAKIQPDVDMKFYPEDGPDGGVQIPITPEFLWPDLSE